MYSVTEQKQRADLRSYVAREAAKRPCISTVVAEYRSDAIDLLFVVEGDLYDGETVVLRLERDLRHNFPDLSFDLMVLPASRYGPDFRWGSNSEVLFRRQ